MSVSKKLAAYHEAGHAVRAYFNNPNSIAVGTIALTPIGGGRWEGTTGIDTAKIKPPQLVIDVALAGLMAEALYNGMESPAATEVVVLAEDQGDLAHRLLDYYAMPDSLATLSVMEKTAVRILREDEHQFSVPSAINFADLNQIPPERRTEPSFARAIARLAKFFATGDHWMRTWLLADALDDWDWNNQANLFMYDSFCKATRLG
jgi:hypothetical protein